MIAPSSPAASTTPGMRTNHNDDNLFVIGSALAEPFAPGGA
jgi:hypothetical protein